MSAQVLTNAMSFPCVLGTSTLAINKCSVLPDTQNAPSTYIQGSINISNEKTKIANSLSAWGMLVSGSLESIQSNNKYALPSEPLANETAISVQTKVLPNWQVRALKQSMFAHLSFHPLAPLIYQEDEETAVIEFNKHASHFVCILDTDGIQFLWIKDDKSHSKFIPDQEISLSKISHNVAQLMDFSK